MYEDEELENARIGHAREHARKAFKECCHLFPEGFPSSLKDAVSIILPGYELHALSSDLPNGLSAITMKNEKLIGYNQKHSPVRIRFTIAHEFGHIRLDHPDGVFSVDKKISKAYETEANVFAGEFLVPLQSLKTAFKSCRDYQELAKQFKVSREVMWIRFQDSKLLSSIL